VVKLVNAGLTATSGSDGSFSLLVGSVGVHGQNTQLKQQASVVTIGNGCLRVNIPSSSTVEIIAYTLQGKAISKTRTLMDAGTHSITLPRISAGVYLYKLKVGNSEFTIKRPLVDGVSHGTALSVQGPSSNVLTKKAKSADAFTDAILATKAGYLSFLRKVTNSDIGNMEIVIKMPVGSGLFIFGLQRQIVMKNIPAGTFTMGSDSSADDADAQPPHQVTLSAFAMQETDVTQEQYLAVIDTNPSNFNTGTDAPLRPVEQVSWYDAVKYCNALSLLSGLTAVYDTTAWTADFSKSGYRLPTEAQWEYACRAGSITEYWWGPDTNGMGVRAWTWYNGGLTTQPVATKLANAFGLYDMTGNVWQWCNDWYGSYTAGAAIDPTGTYRVLRGGSWENYYGGGYRSALRIYDLPLYRFYAYGFRVVLPR
jgi:formylglycine-generating enzyme required for sulfatase activity